MCKPSHKTLVFLLIALLGTICIAIGAWWVSQKPQPVPVPVVNTNTNTQPTEPVVSGTVIPPTKTDCTDELDIECWNTYVNEEYGFSFKFPGGWNDLIERKLNPLENSRKSLLDIYFDSYNKEYDGMPIGFGKNIAVNFSVSENKEALQLSDFIDAQFKQFPYEKYHRQNVKDTKIDGRVGIQQLVTSTTGETEGGSSYDLYVTLNNNLVLSVSFTHIDIISVISYFQPVIKKIQGTINFM